MPWPSRSTPASSSSACGRTDRGGAAQISSLRQPPGSLGGTTNGSTVSLATSRRPSSNRSTTVTNKGPPWRSETNSQSLQKTQRDSPWLRCCILRVTTTSTPSSRCHVFAREFAECVALSRGVLRGSLLDVRQRLWPMPTGSIVTRAERVGFSRELCAIRTRVHGTARSWSGPCRAGLEAVAFCAATGADRRGSSDLHRPEQERALREPRQRLLEGPSPR